MPILTVREYTMMEIMNRVTDKPSWETKVFDDTIASKWKAELLAQKDKDISEKMVDEVRTPFFGTFSSYLSSP